MRLFSDELGYQNNCLYGWFDNAYRSASDHLTQILYLGVCVHEYTPHARSSGK